MQDTLKDVQEHGEIIEQPKKLNSWCYKFIQFYSYEDAIYGICKKCEDQGITKPFFFELNPKSGTKNIARHLAQKHQTFEEGKQQQSSSKQQTITSALGAPYDIKSTQFAKTATRIALYIAKELLPFSTVESESFKLLLSIDPRTRIPSRRTLTRDIFPVMQQYLEEQLKDQLRGNQSIVNCSTDGWSSRYGHSFTGTRVHWISNLWEMKSALLQFSHMQGSHDAEQLHAQLEQGFQDFGIDIAQLSVATQQPSDWDIDNLDLDGDIEGDNIDYNILNQDIEPITLTEYDYECTYIEEDEGSQMETSQEEIQHISAQILAPIITRDSASNIIKACQNAGLISSSCLLHDLHLAVQKAQINSEKCQQMINANQAISRFFHKSLIAGEMLEKQLQNAEFEYSRLIIMVPNRWWTGVSMVERNLECLDVIVATLDEVVSGAIKYTSAQKNKIRVMLANLKKSQRYMEQYVSILSPIQKAATKLGAEKYPTSSSRIPFVLRIIGQDMKFKFTGLKKHQPSCNPKTRQLGSTIF